MFKGDSRDFGESFGGKGGVSGKERKKNLKEGEQSVRFEDEPRPSAPGTTSRWFTGFLRRGQALSGSPFPGARTFPPVGLKDFSPVMVTFKIRGYRLLYSDPRSCHFMPPRSHILQFPGGV